MKLLVIFKKYFGLFMTIFTNTVRLPGYEDMRI